MHYKCRGAGSRSLCKGAGELVLLLLRPTYLFCCKSQAATAKMLPLPFTLPPPFPLFPLPCPASWPLAAPLHMPLYTQCKHDFHLYCMRHGARGVRRWGKAAESWLYLCTPRHAHNPSNLLMLATGDAGPAQAGPGQATRGLLWLLLSLLLFAFSSSSPLFSSTFF